MLEVAHTLSGMPRVIVGVVLKLVNLVTHKGRLGAEPVDLCGWRAGIVLLITSQVNVKGKSLASHIGAYDFTEMLCQSLTQE